jgi:hypothetical protein
MEGGRGEEEAEPWRGHGRGGRGVRLGLEVVGGEGSVLHVIVRCWGRRGVSERVAEDMGRMAEIEAAPVAVLAAAADSK